ncbi:hypothetical protein CIL05_07730 [Virgibacillus profundi]|uniref:Uncharacterized protein n=1 Tax=Virgibacillus profundi TaxID=2024555 RepID=A0A2A2IFM6_9BACI|nr:hypothetical protein [Virgibacillus profundi]PAV30352.1 hypothetical protein CIL05_07730 [Virgibacillus profundi]PXY54524.1 hypothetical protein CIT14_07815 [Virgibacillus profundi]
MSEISQQEGLLDLLNQAQATLDEVFFQLDGGHITVSEEALSDMESVLGRAKLVQYQLTSNVETS